MTRDRESETVWRFRGIIGGVQLQTQRLRTAGGAPGLAALSAELYPTRITTFHSIWVFAHCAPNPAAAAAKTDGRRLRLPSGPRDVPSAERLAREGWRQSAVDAVQSDRLRRCGSSSRCIFGRRRAGRASWRQRASRVTRLVSRASTTWSCSSASRTRWRRTRAASCQFLIWQVRHRAVPNMASAASCSS